MAEDDDDGLVSNMTGTLAGVLLTASGTSLFTGLKVIGYPLLAIGLLAYLINALQLLRDRL